MKFTLRIKKNKVFKYILKKGTYRAGKYIVIHTCQTKYNKDNKKDICHNFFGVCVSKKNGNSVHRNLLKRWVREIYQLEEPTLKKGYNIVILYKKSVTTTLVNFHKLQEDIRKCLKDLALYEKDH